MKHFDFGNRNSIVRDIILSLGGVCILFVFLFFTGLKEALVWIENMSVTLKVVWYFSPLFFLLFVKKYWEEYYKGEWLKIRLFMYLLAVVFTFGALFVAGSSMLLLYFSQGAPSFIRCKIFGFLVSAFAIIGVFMAVRSRNKHLFDKDKPSEKSDK